MARRKVSPYTRQAAPSTSQSPSVKDYGSAREYYNRRYEEVDKKRRYAGLYEDSTKSHRDRMERLWREYATYTCLMLVWSLHLLTTFFRYCEVVNIDPYYTLKKSPADRIHNFFHWMCKEYTVKKVSSVLTYWRQLSQVYIKYKGRRISPLVLEQVSEVRYLH